MTNPNRGTVHEVVVAVGLKRAFAKYTAEIGTWWPRSHRLGEHGIASVTVEPEVGGRILQTDRAGTEHVWSTIRVWEPPDRFVASWELGPTFELQADAELASEFEVRFSPVGDSNTRVQLEHRDFGRHGAEAAPVIEAAVNGETGWPEILSYYKRHGDRWVPSAQAGELETLVSFLDYYRAEFIDRAFGLSDEQMQVTLAPSTLTLSRLVGHMAAVELGWFQRAFAGESVADPWGSLDYEADRDAEMAYAQTLGRTELIALFEAAVADSRARVDAAESLDQLSVHPHPRTGEHWNLRWILLHMIEEYARHCGHADLIRESIDGDTAW